MRAFLLLLCFIVATASCVALSFTTVYGVRIFNSELIKIMSVGLWLITIHEFFKAG